MEQKAAPHEADAGNATEAPSAMAKALNREFMSHPN
jgi:hypothetical protein